MKFFANLLLVAMVAIVMEKCVGRYLLVEVEDEPLPTPRECCEGSNVPEFCLGLCSPADAMARQEKRLTACSEYETIIEKCFQASEGGLKDNKSGDMEIGIGRNPSCCPNKYGCGCCCDCNLCGVQPPMLHKKFNTSEVL